MTRLNRYGELLNAVDVKTAVRQVVEGMLPKSRTSGNRFAVLMEEEEEAEERERHRLELTKDVETMIGQIIAMEKRWFDNVWCSVCY